MTESSFEKLTAIIKRAEYLMEDCNTAVQEAQKVIAHFEGHQLHSDEAYAAARTWLKIWGGFVSVEVDVCWDSERGETFEGVMGDLRKKHPMVQFKTLTMSGPGGGWPAIELFGHRNRVREVVVQMCDGSEFMADEIMDPEDK